MGRRQSLAFGGRIKRPRAGCTPHGEIIAGDTRNDTVVAALSAAEPQGNFVAMMSVKEAVIAKVHIVGIGKFLEGVIAGLLKAEDGELLRLGHRHGP